MAHGAAEPPAAPPVEPPSAAPAGIEPMRGARGELWMWSKESLRATGREDDQENGRDRYPDPGSGFDTEQSVGKVAQETDGEHDEAEEESETPASPEP